jgi:Mn2+/Fe2+ NRAMP family transporter
MSSILQLTLGILTSLGGFVDIGELVFSVQAGVKYGFGLLWAIVIGTIGIMLFSESSGRIAAVTKKPVFTLIKERLSKKLSMGVLLASVLLNVLTCAAELGGVAITLQLLTGLSALPSYLIVVSAMIAIVGLLPFKYLEKIFGLLGLLMVIFVVAVFATHGDLVKAAALGLIPALPHAGGQSVLTYLYFAVGIISSSMMPYEVYFYSSGGVEEKWTPKDILNNRLTSYVGMSLGAIVSASLLILGSQIFKQAQITPQLHGTSALLAAIPFGKTGLIIALLGIMATIAGAALETCLAGAYSISQYFDWKWGRHLSVEKTPRFTITWLAIFVLAFVILLFNIAPVDLVEYAVIFSLLALPFTYYVIFQTASDKKLMGKYKSGIVNQSLSWVYFILVSIIALAAVPLMILTNMGKS